MLLLLPVDPARSAKVVDTGSSLLLLLFCLYFLMRCLGYWWANRGGLFFFFIGWKEFSKQLMQARIINLKGAMGTGKTLLSVALAYKLIQDGLVVRSAFNFPCAFGDAPDPRYCFVVLDEAGTVFDNRLAFRDKTLTQVSGELTYKLRKEGSYMLFPSFLGVDKRFREGIRMWRINYLSNFLWLYHWEFGEEATEEREIGINYFSGKLLFVNPSTFFGVYDTYFAPAVEMSKAFLTAFLGNHFSGVPDDVILPPSKKKVKSIF